MKKLMFALVAAVAAAEAWAIQGTLYTESETLKGDIKWQGRNKQYIISVKKGSTMVDMERKLDVVTRLDSPMPTGYDKAVQQVNAGQGVAAVPVLTKIVADYRMLQWDKPAGRYLALAYLASGNAQKAYEVCQPIVSEDKSAGFTGELAPAYWQALMKLNKLDQLENLLKKAASSGSRQASAAALVMRGDMLINGASPSPEQYRQALRDGYLRVFLMYQDPECRRERVDAAMKAAAVFDKLSQSARAEKLRQQAKQI